MWPSLRLGSTVHVLGSARSIKVLDDPQRFPSSPRQGWLWIRSSLSTERMERVFAAEA